MNLSPNKALELLIEAEKLNPGNWIPHVKNVALAAGKIAEKHPDLDKNTAISLAYLHDIGRRFGITKLRHIIDGYNFLTELGYDHAARIALTHSFPSKDISLAPGEWDCSQEDYLFVKKYIEEIEYDKYDKLIQLCDAIAMHNGIVFIEKRLFDVALRYGVQEGVIKRWKAFIAIKNELEDDIGEPIYNLFPNVCKNSF